MSNLTDSVGDAHLYGWSNYEFVPDRFNNSGSAIYFNKGYLQVPPDVYFNGNFSVTAWININTFEQWQRIFDFDNGAPSDNIDLGQDSFEKLCGEIFQ